MKKYIYGALFLASLVACWIFFFNTPRTANDPASAMLAITFRLPEGYEFTEGAPFALVWQTEGVDGKLSVPVNDKPFNPLASPYQLKLPSGSVSRVLILRAKLYYCAKVSRMCFQGDFETRIPLKQGAFPGAWTWEIEPQKTSGAIL